MEKRGNITIHKKGDIQECSNYRGITILNVAYKVLSKIIKNKLQEYAEALLGDYQQGFRPGRSTTDAIHIMQQILEKALEYDITLHILFIDFKQAFDKVKRGRITTEMTKMGIPQKLVNLVNMTLNETTAIAKIGTETTESFKVQEGVRQGDTLSATLFNIALESAIRKADLGGTINVKDVQIIAYADDVTIISRTKSALIEAFTRLEEGTKNGIKY